jgi:hypothetical protein
MRKLAPLALILLISACDEAPPTYANPGDPERQLVITTETATIELRSRESLDQLKETLKSDTPAQAKLGCPATDAICAQARSLLLKANVPIELSSAENEVTLIYQRVAAVACDNRYKNNALNNNNIAHSSFGCSIRTNMVQSVTNKQHFINPALLDYMDGDKAAQTYQHYLNPPEDASKASGSETKSLIGAAGSQ